jgi:hapalindole-type alkaloid chlorinase
MTQVSVINDSTLRFLDIHVSELENYPNALQEMIFDRRFEGMIIRDVFTSEQMNQVVERLEKNEADINSILVSKFANISSGRAPYLYGYTIIGSAPDLKEYFAYSAAFRKKCRTLFQGHPDFEDQVESVFYKLSGGKPVEVPTGPEGQTYTSATIRVLPDKHEIGVHVGNDFPHLAEASHLKTLINVTDQLSYFIPLSVPKIGGELVVYNLEWQAEEGNQNIAEIKSLEEEMNAIYRLDSDIMNQYESIILKPNPGDMLLFDGGRYYHRVTQVLGDLPRRTIGGFLAFSYKNNRVYYWS